MPPLVLGVPGFAGVSGPADGAGPVFAERWMPGSARARASGRGVALIEAGVYGAARMDEAASVVLAERAQAAGTGAGPLAGLLFDAVPCEAGPLSAELPDRLAARVGQVREPGPAAVPACVDARIHLLTSGKPGATARTCVSAGCATR